MGTLLKNGKLELQSTLTLCNDLVGGHLLFLCFIISCIWVRGPCYWRASISPPGDGHLPYMLQFLSKIDGSISTENITQLALAASW